MPRESTGKTIWKVVYPYLIYMVIAIAVQILFMIPEYFMAMEMIEDSRYTSQLIYEIMMDSIYGKTILITLVSGCICIPVMYFLFHMDKKSYIKRHFIISYEKLHVFNYGYCILIGAAACIFFNMMVDILRLADISPMYQELSNIMIESDFILTFITSAVMAPIFEELLYRGLIYKRLRVRFQPIICMIASSAVFGLAHGNLVQFVYAFCIGIILSFVYEKFKNLWAPIIMHMAANTVSLLLGEGISTSGGWIAYFIIITVSLIGLAAGLWCVMKFVNRINKPLRVADKREEQLNHV